MRSSMLAAFLVLTAPFLWPAASAQEGHAPLSVWQGAAATNDQAIMLHNRGYAYARMGYFLPAIEAYDAALDLAPSWAAGYANRAMAFREIGEPLKALGDVEQSIALDQTMVRRWQEWLSQLGFYDGSIDGVSGPKTQAAIARWAGLAIAEGSPASAP